MVVIEIRTGTHVDDRSVGLPSAAQDGTAANSEYGRPGQLSRNFRRRLAYEAFPKHTTNQAARARIDVLEI